MRFIWSKDSKRSCIRASLFREYRSVFREQCSLGTLFSHLRALAHSDPIAHYCFPLLCGFDVINFVCLFRMPIHGRTFRWKRAIGRRRANTTTCKRMIAVGRVLTSPSQHLSRRISQAYLWPMGLHVLLLVGLSWRSELNSQHLTNEVSGSNYDQFSGKGTRWQS